MELPPTFPFSGTTIVNTKNKFRKLIVFFDKKIKLCNAQAPILIKSHEVNMNFSNLKIGTRLGLAFFVVVLFSAISNFIALRQLNKVGDRWQDFSTVTLEKRKFANDGNRYLGEAVHHFKDFVLRGGNYEKNFSDDITEIQKAVADYQKTGAITDKEKALLDEVLRACDAYRLAMKSAVELKNGGSSIEDIDKNVAGADKPIAVAWNGILLIARQNTLLAGDAINSTIRFGENSTILLAIVVTILSALCALYITRSITKPIGEAVNIACTVASGDLRSRIDVQSTDEVGQLLLALKTMNSSLQNVVAGVRTGTEATASASEQIALGNLDLSTRTASQASALEETASALEELTGTIKQNANNARQANQLAASASDVAVKGGEVVAHVVATMESINESAKKIADIISVIDGIAFQTNILALNAAVEAARAGEQGRGFAVVATEVRNLAQRSSAAAKEIKLLITDSVDKVDVGSKLVGEAGKTMSKVVTSVKQVTDVISEIARASTEQTTGIEQINQAMSDMDNVTQQNAALVEEATAATRSLHDQADNLVQLVSFFETDPVSSMGNPASKSAIQPATKTKYLN